MFQQAHDRTTGSFPSERIDICRGLRFGGRAVAPEDGLGNGHLSRTNKTTARPMPRLISRTNPPRWLPDRLYRVAMSMWFTLSASPILIVLFASLFEFQSSNLLIGD